MNAPLRLGIAGLGTVGASVVRLLEAPRRRVRRAARPADRASSPSARASASATAASRSTLSPGTTIRSALARSNSIDVFVELIGRRGRRRPRQHPRGARDRQGRGHRQQGAARRARRRSSRKLAEERGAQLSFEAAVGGGIPIIKTLREALAGNRLTRLYGILNGTCNFILTRMEEGATYADALKEAQAARLCRSRSELRRRGPRRGAEARDPDQRRLRHGDRPRRRLRRRHFRRSSRKISRRPRSSATASSCSASRSGPSPASSSACIRRWCRATATSPASPA